MNRPWVNFVCGWCGRVVRPATERGIEPCVTFVLCTACRKGGGDGSR